MKKIKLKIFTDFDGTISNSDVWISAFDSFIEDKTQRDELINRYNNYEISNRKVNQGDLDLVKNFSFDRFNKNLDNVLIDKTFHDFYNYCKKNDYDLTILSEGLDYYIDYILKRENLDIKFFSNKLKFSDTDGKLRLLCEFPFGDENCNWCGVSKRNILINNTDEFNGEVSVFIGDGESDACAVFYADIVFAKKKLASFCHKNNITYFEFFTFADVIKKLEKLKTENKLKQKQTAKVNRKDVYYGG